MSNTSDLWGSPGRTVPGERPRSVPVQSVDAWDLDEVLSRLRHEARDRPYLMVAAATAVGFLLGGGLTPGIAAAILGAGARAAALGVVTGFASAHRPRRPLD